MLSGSFLKLGKEDFVLLIVHDISKEKVLEKSIQQTSQKFASVFNNLPVGCAICDNTGVIQEVTILIWSIWASIPGIKFLGN
mgnify:CR=1 FL=1